MSLFWKAQADALRDRANSENPLRRSWTYREGEALRLTTANAGVGCFSAFDRAIPSRQERSPQHASKMERAIEALERAHPKIHQ
jgi:hypothetical protein